MQAHTVLKSSTFFTCSAFFLSLALSHTLECFFFSRKPKTSSTMAEYNRLLGLIIIIIFGFVVQRGRFVAHNNIPTHHIKPTHTHTQDQAHIVNIYCLGASQAALLSLYLPTSLPPFVSFFLSGKETEQRQNVAIYCCSNIVMMLMRVRAGLLQIK